MEFWRFSDFSVRGYIETRGTYDRASFVCQLSLLCCLPMQFSCLLRASLKELTEALRKKSYIIAATIMGFSV